MRKILSILLALAMLVAMSLTATSAEEEKMTLTWLGANPPLTDGTWGETTFEEAFGVDVVIVRAESTEEQSVLFASGEIPDLLTLGSISRVSDLVDQGVLRSITLEQIQQNMPGYYEMCTSYDEAFFTYGIVDNQIFALPRYSATGGATIGAAIRADWLANLNLAVPTTIDELEAAFRAFTFDDPDQNNVNDTYGLTTGGNSTGARYCFQSIFGVYNVNPFFWTENADGDLQYGFTTEKAKTVLKLLASWYAEGLIDPEFITTDSRSSGSDVASRFGAGKVGYMDVVSFDDYQMDNDGHVSAKWVANSESWQKYFADNADDTAAMYKFPAISDFSDEAISPYYINLAPVSDEDGNPGSYVLEGNVNTYFGFGANTSDEKLAKVLSILEKECMDEEAYMLHYGPEGFQWLYAEDGSREYNPQYTELENYHPQGQIIGSGWCLFPMYFANPEYLTVISGDRNEQRYDRTMPLFASFKGNSNALKVSLPSASDLSELTSTFVQNALIKAIIGDIDIDTEWDAIIADWYAQGGETLTEEANEWWATVQ